MRSNAQEGNYFVRVEGQVETGTSGNIFENETAIEFSIKQASLFIQLSKPIYRQGQNVFFRVIPILPNLMPKYGSMTIYVLDPTGFPVRRWLAVQTNAGGIVSQNFTLADQPNYGNWTIQVVAFVLKQHGIKEMFLTSDGWNHFKRFGVNVAPFYRRALPTVNFKDLRAGSKAFDIIRSLDREFPLMVMEFWSGWFDHWGKQHMGSTVKSMMKTFEYIMDAKASINFYMFHGGTNFGFMAGANYFKERGYNPDVTSYDYDAPLSEAGDCTEKYHRIKFMDKVPPDTVKTAYGVLEKVSFMSWENIISYLEKDSVKSKNLFPMESIKRPDGLPFQQYGYILYRKKVSHLKDLTIQSTVRDRLQVLVNGVSQGFYNWTSGSGFKVELKGVDQTLEVTLDLLVENLGLSGQVIKNLDVLENWTIYPLDFRTDFINRIFISEKYRPITGILQTPVLLNFELNISDDPNDTFLSMEGWGKGIVIVNGHNIGRYWEIGPQKTLFILVFEEYKTANSIEFTDKPNLG
ncbi:hypothetical protein KUTeg_006228 [Tegillarca granosa]|uniref:Beta-galactosidase n=1 Tax=Tegillarca granosa TaxID=220873 RepID=A0ABQ9FFY9_TEGGR|nr:hypothetical protein KUTeg_006228 [Tegillarca granosa]